MQAPAVQDSELVSNLPPSGPLFTKEPPESKSEADDKEKPGPQQLQSSEAAPSSSVDKKANGVSPVGKDATEKVCEPKVVRERKFKGGIFVISVPANCRNHLAAESLG